MSYVPRPFYVAEGDPPAKQAILRSALRLFSQRGLAATSIRDIARESGFTNPALYRHFSSKEELALYLFEVCHTRVWTSCSEAISSAKGSSAKLEAYGDRWLALVEEYPDVLAFLSDSARVLWPKTRSSVRRHTMIGLARELVAEAPSMRANQVRPDDVQIAAAALQGTLYELAREIQVGVLPGPALRWKRPLMARLTHIVG